MCEKSFSEADREIVDIFMEFQQALVDNDLDRLNDMILDTDDFINVIGKYQSKNEFISWICDGAISFSNFDIVEPTILFDDDNSASLISKVRLYVEINGKDLRVISDSVVSFVRIGDEWHLSRWDC
jgi:hypothetical protein